MTNTNNLQDSADFTLLHTCPNWCYCYFDCVSISGQALRKGLAFLITGFSYLALLDEMVQIS